jgi:transcriptional regulator GlxA family with amidase domain
LADIPPKNLRCEKRCPKAERPHHVDPPRREQRFYSEFDPKTKHGDRAILRAQLWLLTQRERPVSVADLAQHADLEQRTFLRRFVAATGMKPSEYQQRLRITRAREMLEFSQATIEEISWSLGFGDVTGFRRVFRKVMGLTPSDYRRRFCQPTLQRASSVPDRLIPTSQQSLVEPK